MSFPSYPSAEDPRAPRPASEGALGRYRLMYELASGGMGTVYLARAAGPAGFEKLVALKRIHAHLASDARFVSMFLDEAKIAARIQHPNVCSVIDFGEVDGSYYLTMPYILGESLNRVLAAMARRRDDPLARELPAIAARLVADACEGLHAAHELRDERGNLLEVVHRDVSPQNLMVGYDGVLRVLDFGVASARDRHYQTSTGEVKGKFAYLAPEQIESQPVDRRADVWALGVVLWEAVTGKRLFARESMAATVRAVCDMPIPDVRALRPDAPEGLQAVIERALARDRDARYATARAMGKDLSQVLAREGRFVTAPDVAEWMAAILPDGLRAQEQLVEHTRTGDGIAGAPQAERSTVQPRGALDAVDATVLSQGPAAPVVPGWAPGRAFVIAAVVLVLGAGSGGLLAAFALFGRSAAPDAVAEPSAASSERASASEPRAVEPPADVPPRPRALGELAADAVEPPAAAIEPRVDDAEPPPRADAIDPRVEVVEPDVIAPSAPEPAAERDRPRPARALAPGTVTVATPGGWAHVYLGGRLLGEAPGVFSVPAGRQTLSIAPFGRAGSRLRRTVEVPEGGAARVSVPVAP
ncbi:MAG: protein kinase [Sandaracinaceae bacterium]|nr:protein kinase [Sandaracinaceae bacterium]